jgi:hypothetical protein
LANDTEGQRLHEAIVDDPDALLNALAAEYGSPPTSPATAP